MSFLKKLFGPADPLAGVRRAHQQGRWADALALGAEVDRGALSEAAQQELDELLPAAANSLAKLNLEEGEACLRAGDRARASEHFRLAAAQARDDRLADAARDRLAGSSSPVISRVDPPAHSPGCSGHCHAPAALESGMESKDLDPHTALELIVAGYPAELAARYESLEGPLLEGFLLAHEGLTGEAMSCFEQVPPGQRDDLFHFERGALLARAGHAEEAKADLERALHLNPNHLLALETLVDLQMTLDAPQAEERLRRMLAEGSAPVFAHGRLALLLARLDRPDEALVHAAQAVEGGGDPEVVLLAAGLLEKLERPAEAEALLARLPAGGCGGQTPNLPLAEFWLRHGKNLDRALDAFTAALRHDGHPRWRLRIAQVYLARGWRKEARALLEQVLGSSGLDPEIGRAAMTLIEQCESGST